ncbi:MAG: DUF4190 domain-containing protein [Proteobacteria bacterium]|nr:DUF4190 domain-containing protein [Pseudomonadota bacterium]
MYCAACGTQIQDGTHFCTACGHPLGQNGPPPQSSSATPPATSTAADLALRIALPIGRSGWAIAAGYLAFFSFFVLPAPASLACGTIALIDIAKHPEKTGKPRAIFGIVMGLVGTIMLIGILYMSFFTRH